MMRDANCIPDDMARQGLETRATITFWEGYVPKDASGNQPQDVNKQQGMKPWLDWSSMPEPFNWMTNQPNLQLDFTIAIVFKQS